MDGRKQQADSTDRDWSAWLVFGILAFLMVVVSTAVALIEGARGERAVYGIAVTSVILSSGFGAVIAAIEWQQDKRGAGKLFWLAAFVCIAGLGLAFVFPFRG